MPPINPLPEGTEAPDFEAVAHTGEKVRLSDYKGKIVVLYFYPRAMTPGCTREGHRFEELAEEFEKRGAVILGVSTDSPDRNKRFAEKEGFKHILLLSDEEGKIAESYGVLKPGAKRPSAARVTFIIDKDGVIRKVLVGVRPAERHADLALEAVKELSGE